MITICDCYVCHDESSSRRSRRARAAGCLYDFLARLSAQRIDIRDDVLDGVLTNEHVGDRIHLVAVQILRVATPNACLEVRELSLEIPIAHACEARSIRAPTALPFGAMARRAREIQFRAALRVAARHLCWRRSVRQRRD